MAQLIITVPDVEVPGVADAYGYATLAQQGETKPQFAARRARELLSEAYLNGRQRLAREAAGQGLAMINFT